MNLEINVRSNSVIATNVGKVAEYYMGQLAKYDGMVATRDTLKEDKKTCANINKLKKFVSEQRIAFDKAVNAQPDVKAVHDALRSIEIRCDEVRNPYWNSVKAIENENKMDEKKYNVKLIISSITMLQIDKLQKYLDKENLSAVISVD